MNNFLKKYKKWTTFNDLIEIECDIPLLEQIDNLKEDMFQLEKGEIIVDIGWNPDFDIKGHFIIKIIDNFNWEKPLAVYYTNNCKKMFFLLERILFFVFEKNIKTTNQLKNILKKECFPREHLKRKRKRKKR